MKCAVDRVPSRSRRAYPAESIQVSPFLRRKSWCNDVAVDFDLALEESEDVVFLLLDWDELGHRLAALGDQHRLTLGPDFVHDFEAMYFELACGHGFHGNILLIMVIRPWS